MDKTSCSIYGMCRLMVWLKLYQSSWKDSLKIVLIIYHFFSVCYQNWQISSVISTSSLALMPTMQKDMKRSSGIGWSSSIQMNSLWTLIDQVAAAKISLPWVLVLSTGTVYSTLSSWMTISVSRTTQIFFNKICSPSLLLLKLLLLLTYLQYYMLQYACHLDG